MCEYVGGAGVSQSAQAGFSSGEGEEHSFDTVLKGPDGAGGTSYYLP